MADSTTQDGVAEVGAGSAMTLRIYVVDRYGTVTSDTGTRRVDCTDAVSSSSACRYPPCSCPDCVRKRARR